MIREDSWDLIPDVPSTQLLQPTPKSCPLSRPTFELRPRLPAMMHASARNPACDNRFQLSGPRLTVAGISAAAPAAVPGYEPVRSNLFHHVSHVACPYDRVVRTEYHPVSLQMRSSSSSPSPSDLDRISMPDLRPSTAAALPCPPINKGTRDPVDKPYPSVRPSTAIQLTRSKLTSDNPFLIAQFAELLSFFGNSSEVHRSLVSSPFADEHRKRLLNNYAATTVFRYLQAVQKFVRVTTQLGMDIHALSESQLADALTVMQQSRSCDTDRDVSSGNFTIKALRWWYKIAGVTNFQICFSPLVDSFLKTKLSKDKREAPPLPLWLLFQWERRVLQSAATVYETMMLGAFLLITWAGLRFADAQRLNVDSLVFNFQELRGLVWRSKTMAAGHPFGVQAAGLCSTGTFTWLFKFLQTWDQLMRDLQIPRSQCDFLIPAMQPDGTIPEFEPLDYAGTTKIFRAMLMTPWKRFQGDHPLERLQMTYTLHSMKATLLSFGPQLGTLVSDSDRLLQGHHQDQKQSLNLYGRDSVWGSLRYQQTVTSQIQQGWRPKTAQHRGGQFPLVEPTVVLERYKKAAPDYRFEWLPFHHHEEPQELPPVQEVVSEESDTDPSSSDSDTDSKSSEQALSAQEMNPKKQEPIQADEAVFARHRRVTHAMVIMDDGNESRPVFMGHLWKASCGARMRHSETEFLDEWHPSMAFCQHAGCKRVWAAINLQ